MIVQTLPDWVQVLLAFVGLGVMFWMGHRLCYISLEPLLPKHPRGTPPYLVRAQHVVLFEYVAQAKKEFLCDDDPRIVVGGEVLAHSEYEAMNVVKEHMAEYFKRNHVGWGPVYDQNWEGFEFTFRAKTAPQIRSMTNDHRFDWVEHIGAKRQTY